MKQSESPDLVSSRRSFIFGVGAFAAGIFLPVKKLYFPVADSLDLASNLVLPSQETYLWMISKEIPTKIAPKGYSEVMRYSAYFRKKHGSPPRNPMDGERVEDEFMKSLDRTTAPGVPMVRFKNLDCNYYEVKPKQTGRVR